MKKILLFMLLIMFFSCKKEVPELTEHEKASELLRGRWESIKISSKEQNPPVRLSITITSYKKTKLTYLKMIAHNKEGEKRDNTIRVNLDKKGYIVPSLQKEIKQREDSFIKYNPEHRKKIETLEWEYSLSGDVLTIMSKGSKILLRKMD